MRYLFTFLLLIGSLAYAEPHSPETKIQEAAIQASLKVFNEANTEAQYQQALDNFKQLHKTYPTDKDLSFYLGRSLYRNHDIEAADKVLSKNIERYPDHVESHYVLGSVKLTRVAEVSVFKKIGMAKAAIEAWEEAARLDPTHVEVLYGVVEFYSSAPGIAGGDDEIGKKKLIELEALSVPWANLSKASRAMRAESFAEAEALFRKAITGIPERAFPQLMLANAYVRQEKFDEALIALAAYKNRDKTWNDPGVSQTELMAARIYQGLGRGEDALTSLDLVLASNPSETIRDQAKQEIKKIK